MRSSPLTKRIFSMNWGATPLRNLKRTLKSSRSRQQPAGWPLPAWRRATSQPFTMEEHMRGMNGHNTVTHMPWTSTSGSPNLTSWNSPPLRRATSQHTHEKNGNNNSHSHVEDINKWKTQIPHAGIPHLWWLRRYTALSHLCWSIFLLAGHTGKRQGVDCIISIVKAGVTMVQTSQGFTWRTFLWEFCSLLKWCFGPNVRNTLKSGTLSSRQLRTFGKLVDDYG